MRVVALGTDDEVRGFVLAGTAGEACRTPAEAARALERLAVRGDEVALVLVSARVAAWAAARVEALAARSEAPLVLVLPAEANGNGVRP